MSTTPFCSARFVNAKQRYERANAKGQPRSDSDAARDPVSEASAAAVGRESADNIAGAVEPSAPPVPNGAAAAGAERPEALAAAPSTTAATATPDEDAELDDVAVMAWGDTIIDFGEPED